MDSRCTWQRHCVYAIPVPVFVLGVLICTGLQRDGNTGSLFQVTSSQFSQPHCLQLSTRQGVFQATREDGIAQPRSMADKWGVRLCTRSKSSGIWGTVRMVKKLLCSSERRVSPGDRFNEWLRAHAGPDEVFVTLEGAEVVGGTAQYRGNCTYELPFHVTVEGRYALRILHLREDYRSVDELTQKWAPLHFDAVLGTQLFFVNIGGNETTRALEKERASRLLLPVCGDESPRIAPGDGRWLTTNTSENIFLEAPYFPSHRQGPIPHAVDPTQLTWAPFDCRLVYNDSVASSCLRNMSINFVGDSHMRTFYNAFVSLVCSSERYALKGYGESQCLDFNETCPGLHACYTCDFTGDISSITRSSTRWDAVILNFGHHPFSGKMHWTLQQLEDRVNSMFAELGYWFSHSVSPPPVLIWQATQPWPLRNDRGVKQHHDWRTAVRVNLWNDYVQRKVLASQYPKWRYHAINVVAEAMTDAYPDRAHFPPFSKEQAIAQCVPFLHLLGCKTSPG